MTFTEALKKETHSIKGGSWNIGFTDPEGGWDETQFDLEDHETEADLEQLWKDFVAENPEIKEDSIVYIEPEENPA